MLMAGLLVSLATSVYALNVDISGKVTKYGIPMENVRVSMEVDTLTVFDDYTDSLGLFSKSIQTTFNSGNIIVSVIQCDGMVSQVNLNYNTFLTTFTNVDFSYCLDSLLHVNALVTEYGLPAALKLVDFSLDRFQSVYATSTTSLLGTFYLPIAIPNQVSGWMQYRYLDCNQSTVIDSFFYVLGDTVDLNISSCSIVDTTSVFGQIVSPGQQPVNNYRLQLIAFDSITAKLYVQQTVLSDAFGNFKLLDVPEANYLLRCLPPSNFIGRPLAAPVYFNQARFWNREPVMFLQGGQTLPNLIIDEILPSSAQGIISGQVTWVSEMEEELANAPLYLLREIDSAVVSYALQDMDGQYRFDNVADGDYLVYLDYPGLPTDAPLITVAGGQTVSDIHIKINQAGVSYGTFIGAEEAQEQTIHVYPNPCVLELLVVLDKAKEVSIVSVDGRRVYGPVIGVGEHRINTSNWPAGNYWIRTKGPSGIIHHSKLIKM